MNASQRLIVERALRWIPVDPRYGAACLATLHRAVASKTQKEIEGVVAEHPAIAEHLEMVNGCLVPKITGSAS